MRDRGPTLAFASALVTNMAQPLEHYAAAALPPLSPRRPFRSAEFLLRDRRWLAAFAAETTGWLSACGSAAAGAARAS